MKLPETQSFIDEDGQSFPFKKASDAPGQVGALYLPDGHLTVTIKTATGTNTIPLGFKYYANASIAFDSERIQALRSLPHEPHTTSILAIPVEVGRRYGTQNPCGFYMPLFEKHKGLDACFPYENYIDLCNHKRSDGPFIVAANLAFAVQHAHSCGLTIGDFNPKNFMVDPRTGLVRIIDVDGMQFFTPSGKTYLTDVIQPEYPTPYLRGKKPLPIEHDRFALAMLIFRILNLGAHPFYLTRSDNRVTSPDHNIINRLYGYSPEIAERENFVISPERLRPSDYSETLAQMFVEAFTTNTPPTALQWHKALTQFIETLEPCSRVPGHRHPRGEPCYLCAFERRSQKRSALYQGMTHPPAPFKLATKENILIDAPPASSVAAPSASPIPNQSSRPQTPSHSPAWKQSLGTSNAPVAPRAPPPTRRGFVKLALAMVAAVLFLNWYYDDDGTSQTQTSPQHALRGNYGSSYTASVVAWFGNDQVHAEARNPIWHQTRTLMLDYCVAGFVHVDFVSFYPGSGPLSVTRRRAEALDLAFETMAYEYRAVRYTSTISYAHTSRHPRAQAPNPTLARGRSIHVTVSCDL